MSSKTSNTSCRLTATKVAVGGLLCVSGANSFVTRSSCTRCFCRPSLSSQMSSSDSDSVDDFLNRPLEFLSRAAVSTGAAAALFFGAATTGPLPSFGENELAAKYGGKVDTSLVDKNCLLDKCSLQAKTCLGDDPECRKGLTCVAKCTGDTKCVTGCFARYGSEKLDGLLKCTIEDNECIKIAILPGGADMRGTEPPAPAPTVRGFNVASIEGSWFKVIGFNPNYDCYACQRNTFSAPEAVDQGLQRSVGFFSGTKADSKLAVDVEFSMPRFLPDGTPLPPSLKVEQVVSKDGLPVGSQSIAYNQFNLHEEMVFDRYGDTSSPFSQILLGKKDENGIQKSFSRTAHSEGDMFGLKFWENWYVIGQNELDEEEFKFVYYNGKTRQNTYKGAFVYSRTKELGDESLKKVYKIASDAGMNPDGFCKIRNGCFKDEEDGGLLKKTPEWKSAPPLGSPLRAILASTRVSELVGIQPVYGETKALSRMRASGAAELQLSSDEQPVRPWWKEVGDYLEDPHKHFQLIDSLRVTMDWPESVREN